MFLFPLTTSDGIYIYIFTYVTWNNMFHYGRANAEKKTCWQRGDKRVGTRTHCTKVWNEPCWVDTFEFPSFIRVRTTQCNDSRKNLVIITRSWLANICVDMCGSVRRPFWLFWSVMVTFFLPAVIHINNSYQ